MFDEDICRLSLGIFPIVFGWWMMNMLRFFFVFLVFGWRWRTDNVGAEVILGNVLSHRPFVPSVKNVYLLNLNLWNLNRMTVLN